MPLIKSKSKAAFGKNVATEVKAGKPVKQAVAIAYNTKRAVKKAAGGSLNPMNYDSDVDYYKSIGDPRGNEDDDEGPDLAPKMSAVKKHKMTLNTNKLIANRKMADVATAKGDKPEADKQWDRLKKRGESNRLQRFAKSSKSSGEAEKTEKYRKEWSEKIGGGKAAPFKKGGSTKSCW